MSASSIVKAKATINKNCTVLFVYPTPELKIKASGENKNALRRESMGEEDFFGSRNIHVWQDQIDGHAKPISFICRCTIAV